MELTQQQNRVFERIKAFLESDASVFILRGYAGTGKTTMIKVVADYIAQNRQVRLMAPTGRAARVLSQKTGHPATTIHKAIYEKACMVANCADDIAESEFKLVFPVKNSDTESQIVAIVDEASMVSSRTMAHVQFVFGTDNLMDDLLTYVRPNFGGKIIFVGDPAQLPPVGEPVSNALNADYFRSRQLNVVEEELNEVLRQKNDSLILKNAMMIRDQLKSDKRNHLVFEEKVGDVESIPSDEFLGRYLDYRKASGTHDSVIICYSNRSASRYNKEIRMALYGRDVPVRENDILQIVQNNYMLGRMNGDFVPVLSVGGRIKQSAPVYTQVGSERKRVVVDINFVQVTVPYVNGAPQTCMLVEDLLTSDEATMSVDENRALYINFCMRNPKLKPGTEEFANALMVDVYYNAIRAKYGYAVTGHKCQGGEWGKVFVDYSGRTGLNDDCLRWAYTATTRAKKTLYVANLPHITPFSKFRIDPIQKSKNMNAECRIIAKMEPTPFHNESDENYLKAKYMCIVNNMHGTPYSVAGIISRPYKEVYSISTPCGIENFTIFYKAGGIFMPAQAESNTEHTRQVLLLLNDERNLPFVFSYTPSDETHERLYNLIRSACDGLSIQLTNVVEHPEDYSVVFYMQTNGGFSYIKIYISMSGFITYAKPMSMHGADDGELSALINEINKHLI